MTCKSVSNELRSATLLLVVLFSLPHIVGAQSGAAEGGPTSGGPSAADETAALLQQARALSADELMELADDALFPESFVATMRMTTERPGRRTTEMVLENSHLEGSGSFMEVLEPRRSSGMRFLQKNDDLWMYNPRSSSRRALRLSPRDSFQGSVFSNNDVSDPDYSDDYSAGFAGTEELAHGQVGRVETVRITAQARHDESAYGQIEMWLWPDPAARSAGGAGAAGAGAAGEIRVIPLRIDYYSRSGLPFKRMILESIEPLAGARRPTVMRMESLEEEGAITVVRIESLEARDNLPARRFSRQELTR